MKHMSVIDSLRLEAEGQRARALVESREAEHLQYQLKRLLETAAERNAKAEEIEQAIAALLRD